MPSAIPQRPVEREVTFCVRGVVSPVLSNLYLTEVDRMLERAKAVTRSGQYTAVEYARFADDLVILLDAHPRHAWLLTAVNKRLREELASLQVEVNEEKSRIVDLAKGESFDFLGFTIRRLRSKRGGWWPQRTPQLKKRTALLRKLKEVFRSSQSHPIHRVVGGSIPCCAAGSTTSPTATRVGASPTSAIGWNGRCGGT